MKVLAATTIATSSISVTVAFAPPQHGSRKLFHSLASYATASSNEIAKPISDPLGLYPENSEERINGRIQPLIDESDIDLKEPMVDRLGIYQSNSLEDVETEDQSKSLYDPLRLYPETSEERKNNLIKPMEESNDVTPKVIMDPLRIYPNQIKTDEGIMDNSDSLPFLPRPPLLDRSMPGDVGFDPFNFAGKDTQELYLRREAEIKHGRIAMLAAAGWPLSELMNDKIANMFHLPSLLEHGDKVPSLLNGGLETVSPVFWLAVVGFAGGLEGLSMSKEPRPIAGDYGFDPLNMYPKDIEGQQRMQLAEVTHGRLAMLAITFFVYQELFTNLGVIHQIPLIGNMF